VSGGRKPSNHYTTSPLSAPAASGDVHEPVPVAILGAGGHGREVLQALRTDAGAEFVGFLDDAEPDPSLLDRIDASWLGPSDELSRLPADVHYLIGIGSGDVRRRVDARVRADGRRAYTLIHPKADVGEDVELAPGVVVFAGATVTTNIRLGRHTHVGRGAAVGHDARLGDYVSVYPLASVSGSVTLEDGVTVGTTAAIRQGVRIGAGAVVGMGAVVLRDVPAGCTVVGVPATVTGSERVVRTPQ
jgi:sugar O-acyltransferase (sialic acid O-acetyltransferase NeuD family)